MDPINGVTEYGSSCKGECDGVDLRALQLGLLSKATHCVGTVAAGFAACFGEVRRRRACFRLHAKACLDPSSRIHEHVYMNCESGGAHFFTFL